MSRFSIIYTLLIAAFLWGCKASTTGPGNNPTTTPTSVGDTMPRKLSIYNFEKSQMDTMDFVDPATIQVVFAEVDSTGMSFQGKNPVYFINDDEEDSTYFSYESNGDVSIYFQHPGYYQIFHNPEHGINEPLQQVADIVFHQWITFPIASEDTSSTVIYNASKIISITTKSISTDIYATKKFMGDTTITISGTSMLAKHCRINIFAKINEGTSIADIIKLTQTRDLLFVPKIGYFAKVLVRTNMPEYKIQLIPQDTTRRQRILTSYHLQ